MVKRSKKKQLSIVTFVVGDFVFAKLKGSQPWPSIVREFNGKKVLVDFICPEKSWYVNKNYENLRLFIHWFIGTNFNVFIMPLFISNRAWISTADVQSFSDNLVNWNEL